jgi:anti-sigma factor RsiW
MTSDTSSDAPMVPVIDCHTAVQRLWDYLDDELDDARVAEVTQHVESCRNCAEHYAFARTFLQVLSATRNDTEVAQSMAALRAGVEEALGREGFLRG